MSEDEKVVNKVSSPAPMTAEQLAAALLETQKQLAAALKDQADALRESRKPYVDPKVLAQKQADLEERRKAVALDAQTRANKKKSCLHRRTNGDGTWSDRLNISWQEHSNGIILGVCGTCGSPFDARIPEDRKFLLMPGPHVKNMGKARQDRFAA